MRNDGIIDATELRVRDKDGNLRALLSANSFNGLPFLNFYADDEIPRMTLSIDTNGTPHITLFRANKVAVSIGLSDHGAGVSVHDRRGIPRLEIKVSDESEAGLAVLDEDGETVWETP